MRRVPAREARRAQPPTLGGRHPPASHRRRHLNGCWGLRVATLVGVSAPESGLVTGDDGVTRCFWGDSPEIYRGYHDSEWGFPVRDDRRLFEKLCLEGFQAGLSWLTILRKRENFRAAFAGFD